MRSGSSGRQGVVVLHFVTDHNGKLLADSSQPNTAHATNVFEQTGNAAQALIDRIIADNLGSHEEPHATAPAKSAGV